MNADFKDAELLQRKGRGELKENHQFSPLRIIQSHADLAIHYLNPPQPPFAKGGRGDFWGIFSEGKCYLFQKAKLLQR